MQNEVAKFKAVVPLGVDSGWYDTYQIVFTNPHPVTLRPGSIPGYVVALVFKRRDQAFTSFFYIYAIAGMFTKVRLTVPAEGWGNNPALDWPAELIRDLAKSR